MLAEVVKCCGDKKQLDNVGLGLNFAVKAMRQVKSGWISRSKRFRSVLNWFSSTS